MRLSAHKPSDIRDRIQAIQDGRPVDTVEGDELPLSQREDFGADESTVILDAPALVPAPTTPTSTDKRRRRSGAASEAGASGPTIIDHGDTRSPTTQKVNCVNLSELLIGVSRGQKIRRFREHIDEKKLAVSKQPAEEQQVEAEKVKRMEKGYAVMLASLSFTPAVNVLSWSEEEYLENMQLLKEFGAEYTSEQEEFMIERFVRVQSRVAISKISMPL
jgi:hypothetical protein